MTNAHRDLAAPEHWTRSLERSRRRRDLLPKARRENRRKKHLSAALATAVVAGPATPLAAAQVTSGDLSAAVASQSPANRAIEIREGGLPLRAGSEGDLVVQVQRALHVDDDGIFGVQTDAAVRSYQQARGLDVDGIVGLVTWGTLFPEQTRGAATGAAVGGQSIPAAAQTKVQETVQQAGSQLAAQRNAGFSGTAGSGTSAVGTTGIGTTGTGAPTTVPDTTPVASPAPGTTTVRGCGSSTIVRPVSGPVTSDFGPRWGRNHDGLDIGASTGTPVRAAACGTVSLAGQQSGYGNIICVTHTSRFTTCYAHLSRFGVSTGAHVQQGQVIGYVGCTGNCTGPHLHFETRVGGVARDPKPYLGGASMPGATSRATATSASATRSSTTPTSAETTTAAAPADQAPAATTPTAQAPATTPTAQAPAGTTPTATSDGTVTAGTVPATVSDGTVTDTTVTGTVPTTPPEPAPAPTAPAPAEAAPAPAPAPAVPAEAAPAVPAEAAPAAPAPAADATVAASTETVATGDGTVAASSETGTDGTAADPDADAATVAAGAGVAPQ
jgi:murein DD-endopeptidase MepM/ murein hydrolase activator NlpD